MRADATTEKAIKDILDKMSEGYHKRDMGLILSLFESEGNVMIYGTGADEKRTGISEIEKQVERDWSQTDETNMLFDWVSVNCSGNVAWVASDVRFKLKAGGQDMEFPGRLTLVLVNKNSQWFISHGHWSFPATSQEEGDSFPT